MERQKCSCRASAMALRPRSLPAALSRQRQHLTVHASHQHADVLGDAVYLRHAAGVCELVGDLVLQARGRQGTVA